MTKVQSIFLKINISEEASDSGEHWIRFILNCRIFTDLVFHQCVCTILQRKALGCRALYLYNMKPHCLFKRLLWLSSVCLGFWCRSGCGRSGHWHSIKLSLPSTLHCKELKKTDSGFRCNYCRSSSSWPCHGGSWIRLPSVSAIPPERKFGRHASSWAARLFPSGWFIYGGKDEEKTGVGTRTAKHQLPDSTASTAACLVWRVARWSWYQCWERQLYTFTTFHS